MSANNAPLVGSCAILGLFFAICLLSMVNLTPTYDEPDYFDFGLKALTGDIHSVNMQRSPITAFNALFGLIFGGYSSRLDFLSLYTARIATVIAGVLLGCYVMVWSRRLYGSAGMLLSLTLFAFCPTVIAHARLVTSDIYCALFMFMFVFHLTAYLHTGKRSDYFFMIVAFSLAILSKQTAVLVLVVALLAGVSYVYWFRGEIKRFAFNKVLFAVVSVLFILNAAYGFYFYSMPLQESVLFYPISRLYLPLPQVFVDTFLLGMQYNKNGYPAYLAGQYSVQGWWYYFPVLFLLKMPIAYLILLVFQAVVGLKRRIVCTLDAFVLMTSVVVIGLFFVLFCHVDIGIRYIIPVLPFLFVLSGGVGRYVEERGVCVQRYLVASLVVFYIVSSLSFFPHFIQYGNEFVSRRIDLYKYFADSNLDWGQSYVYAAKYIRSTLAAGKVIHLNPDQPAEGIIIVNANALLDIFEPKHDKFSWLRDNFEPIDHVAYNWLVFDTADTSSRINNK
jgi:4-amino-4-deoxy-L-arabinose transferase-like glycosyltransferase